MTVKGVGPEAMPRKDNGIWAGTAFHGDEGEHPTDEGAKAR